VTSPIGLLWSPELQFGRAGVTTDKFLAAAQAFLPDKELLPQLLKDITPNLRQGSGTYVWYESKPDAQIDDYGIFGLASPADGNGALVILVSRNGSLGNLDRTPSPEDLRVASEMTVAVFQVITRLCGPDQSGVPSGDPSDMTWNVACTSDQ
jgi:hypothetical protein